MTHTHTYELSVKWAGNTGNGTAVVNGYAKDHEVRAAGKPAILASADPSFQGDPARYNPEELLVAALSQCHMLWYLSSCARAGVTVTAYRDEAIGTMTEHTDGSGEFEYVILRPHITLADASQQELADRQHERAHHLCFIARSVNFPVTVEATYEQAVTV